MIHVIIGVGAAGITAAKTIRENDPCTFPLYAPSLSES